MQNHESPISRQLIEGSEHLKAKNIPDLAVVGYVTSLEAYISDASYYFTIPIECAHLNCFHNHQLATLARGSHLECKKFVGSHPSAMLLAV